MRTNTKGERENEEGLNVAGFKKEEEGEEGRRQERR